MRKRYPHLTPQTKGTDGETYWFAGALWDKTDDQLPRFLAEGIWENGYEDQFSELVRRMKPGDRIAIKASFVQTRGLPFDVGGKPVSVMRIKATGTILENLNDGKRVRVAWDPSRRPSRLVLLHISNNRCGGRHRERRGATSCGFRVPWRTAGLRVVSSATLLGSEIRGQN